MYQSVQLSGFFVDWPLTNNKKVMHINFLIMLYSNEWELTLCLNIFNWDENGAVHVLQDIFCDVFTFTPTNYGFVLILQKH